MKKILFSLTAVLAATAVSNAAVIAYEGFNYTADLNMPLTGGTGWNNDWTVQTNTGTMWTTNATGLTYSDGTNNLVVSGGSMLDSSTSGDTQRWRRNFAIPGGSWGTSGNSTWFSYLSNRTDGNPGTTVAWNFRLQQDNVTLAQIRIISGATNGWEIADSSNTQQASTTSVSELGLVFIVGRVVHVSGNDLMEVWLNPNLTTPGTATMSATFANFSGLNGFSPSFLKS